MWSFFSIFRNKANPNEVERILQAAGYEIVSRQPKATVITEVNGQEHVGGLEADFLVRKNKEQYLVLVKQGEGNDPTEPVFRRKLLELDYAFAPSGLLLLDSNEGRLDRVEFSFPRERNLDVFFRGLIWLFIILGGLGIIWLLTTIKLF
jgi:hypothetical protein